MKKKLLLVIALNAILNTIYSKPLTLEEIIALQIRLDQENKKKSSYFPDLDPNAHNNFMNRLKKLDGYERMAAIRANNDRLLAQAEKDN